MRCEATGFVPEQTWGERIEDRGSQITFSALGQQAPLDAKDALGPRFRQAQGDPGGPAKGDCRACRSTWAARPRSTSRARASTRRYGLNKLSEASGIALDAMLFMGDAIFPGGNDYPAKELGLDTVRVRDPRETISVIAAIVACLRR